MISSKPLLAAKSYDDEQRPGKGDLYSDDELFDLLNLHLALNSEEQLLNGELNVAVIPGGIHDLVLMRLMILRRRQQHQHDNNLPQTNFDSTICKTFYARKNQ